MVIDTSIILAIILNEKFAPWAITQLREHRRSLMMSTVNLAESLIRVKDILPNKADFVEKRIQSSKIKLIPVSVEHAKLAATARLKFPLNLGDCFAYALAKATNQPLIALDGDFLKTDITVVLPPK